MQYDYKPLWQEFNLEPPVNRFDYELTMPVAQVTPAHNAPLLAMFARVMRDSGLPLESTPKLYITTFPIDAQALILGTGDGHVLLNAHVVNDFYPNLKAILQYLMGHELAEIYYAQTHTEEMHQAINNDDLPQLREKERFCDRVGLLVCEDIDAVIHYMDHPEQPIVELPKTHPSNEERCKTFRQIRDSTPHWRDILAVELEQMHAPNRWQRHLDRADKTPSANPRSVKLVDFIR